MLFIYLLLPLIFATAFYINIYYLIPLCLIFIFYLAQKKEFLFKKKGGWWLLLIFFLLHNHWLLSLYQFSNILLIITAWLSMSIFYSFLYYFILFSLLDFLKNKKYNLILIPLAYTLWEFLLGFCYSLYSLSLTQIYAPWSFLASVNTLFLTFSLVFFCYLLAKILIIPDLKPKRNFLLIIFLIILFITAWGLHQKNKHYINDNPFNFLILQPSIQQQTKLDSAKHQEILNIYMDLITLGLKNKPEADLLILPETIIPSLWEDYIKQNLNYKINLENRYLVFGLPTTYQNLTYNSILFFHKGTYYRKYLKKKLVPFGEYQPFSFFNSNRKNYFSAFKEKQKDFYINNKKILPLICFESTIPAPIIFKNKYDFILVLTNDGWFWDTFKEIHLRSAILRAIEYKTPLLFCANDGISAFILPNGKIASLLPSKQTGYIFNSF